MVDGSPSEYVGAGSGSLYSTKLPLHVSSCVIFFLIKLRRQDCTQVAAM